MNSWKDVIDSEPGDFKPTSLHNVKTGQYLKADLHESNTSVLGLWIPWNSLNTR